MAAELINLIIRSCCECDRPEKYDVDTVELRVSDLRGILEAHLASLLPGVHYMDPPDGGDVSVSEQLSRMAEDAAAYRALATQQATQGAEPVGKLIVSRPFQDYHPGPPAFDLPDGEHPIYTAPPPTAEVEKKARQVMEICAGWQSSTFGWQGNEPGAYERARQAHDDECLRRVIAALQSDQAQAAKEPKQ